MITEARNAELQDIFTILTEQRARRHDLVVPAGQLKFKDGLLIVSGADPVVDDAGVTDVNGVYTPTEVFDSGLAQRLDIPIDLIRRFRVGRYDANKRKVAPRIDLFDALVNGYLQGRKGKLSRQGLDKLNQYQENGPVLEGDDYVILPIEADGRKFTVRLFVGEDGNGIARALLSNRFAIMDNLDALAAMLQGFNDSGLDTRELIVTGDLSEKRMYINVDAPGIFTEAPGLLEGYRSPFSDSGVATQRMSGVEERMQQYRDLQASGRIGSAHQFFKEGTEPVVSAGFCLSNSEVGLGQYQLVPRLRVLACLNGLIQTKDTMAKRHVGASLEEGAVDWSERTTKKNLDLITSMTTDAVTSFLSKEYVEKTVRELEAKAGKPIGPKAQEVIESIAKKVGFDDTAAQGIFEHFLMGGQRTSGGLMQAITSYSQTVPDADEAYELDSKAVQAMELAFAAS